jgi:2-succinyl-5-enolpyruvyl-6-hydroxy-3-cyclohexene-1-carboxylate synthase
MYTVLKNYQILIALLKEYGVKHLVLSAGTRNVPFVHSVEVDSDFVCYSVVDERSAAYFAMGIAQEINAPVAISCTSSTATANYYPAVTEAYHMGIPLVVITSDRNPYFLGQLEDQMIDQNGMYGKVVRKSVNLPYVNDEEDFWYCERLVNEALLELSHRGRGPVQINVPTFKKLSDFSVKHLPEVKKIERISLQDDLEAWNKRLEELTSCKRILVIVGQNYCVPEEMKKFLELFSIKFNCVVAIDHMSNLNSGDHFVETSKLIYGIKGNEFNELFPDLVISFGGNFISQLKGRLRRRYHEFRHWLINENGDVIDVFKALSVVFECTPLYFFKYTVENVQKEAKNDFVYKRLWLNRISEMIEPELPFSNVSVIKDFVARIPSGSILHLSVLNSIRITNFFKLPENIKVYANMGSHGIDGCMSTFLGHAAISDKLSFLIIGDLSFFYDMNSIRIKHIKSNVRILLINNRGGAEFYKNHGKDQIPTLDLHTSARHNTSAKLWAESVGFDYLSAGSENDLTSQLDRFFSGASVKPIIFEVFTEMETDSEVLKLLSVPRDGVLVGKSKKVVKSLLGPQATDKLKKLIKK